MEAWIGRREEHADVVSAVPVAALAATLDEEAPFPQPGDALPPLRHWLFFLGLHRRSDLASDGHVARGGFLPPIALPRRMWAGGRLRFVAPLRVGERIRRVSTIASIAEKTGRSGALTFVTVRHEISNDHGLALSEEQDLVYRAAEPPGAPAATRTGAPATVPGPTAADALWSRVVRPDEVLLFRYSALTFNGHRIHYDRRYVTEEEGYPGLIVHGPLIATLLADLACSAFRDQVLREFTFRASAPLFDLAPFRIHGRPAGDGRLELWAETPEGSLAMHATALMQPQA
jgi:3-methylfumaryl-CoA hydratase